MTSTKESKHHHSLKYLTILLVIIALPFVLWGIANLAYQFRVTELRNALNSIDQHVIRPRGGVKVKDIGECLQLNQAHFAYPCPNLQSFWLVPLAPDERVHFLSLILKEEGYVGKVDKDEAEGKKGHTVLMLVLDSGSTEGYRIPYSLSGGRQWSTLNALIQ